MRILVAACLWAFAVLAQAAAPAGEFTLSTGLATATSRDGSVRNVAKGGNFYPGEVINTGPNSYLNLKFRDGGLMLLRPNTRFQIEQFVYEGEEPKPDASGAPVVPTTPVAPGAASRSVAQVAVFRLIKGGLRSVTGLIGKRDFADYQLKTPTATIGIRGTEFVTWTCDLACASDPVVGAALKQAFGENFDFSSTEVIGTLKGKIEVTNTSTGETQEVKVNEYVLSTPQGDIPLPREPEFIAKDRIPDPKTCL